MKKPAYAVRAGFVAHGHACVPLVIPGNPPVEPIVRVPLDALEGLSEADAHAVLRAAVEAEAGRYMKTTAHTDPAFLATFAG